MGVPFCPQPLSLHSHKFSIKKVFIIQRLVQLFQLDASKTSNFKFSSLKICLWQFVVKEFDLPLLL